MRSATIKKLRDAVGRRPGDSAAWLSLAKGAFQVGDIVEGKSAMEQALTISHYEPEIAIDSANLLAHAGLMADAEVVLRNLVEQHPREIEGRAGLARLLLETDRGAEAAREATVALRFDPKNVEVRLLAAEVQERIGALAEAADHLAVVVSSQPNHLDANRQLANILTRLGDSPGVIRCLRRVAGGTSGKDVNLLTLLAQALSSDGQHDEAVQLLTDVAKQAPNFSAAFANLGMALIAAGQIEEGVGVLSRALELDPRSPQAFCGLGIAYQKMGRWDDSVEAFKAMEQVAPGDAVASLNLGLALDAVGDKDGARRALVRAAAIAPEDREIRTALDQFLLRTAPPQAPPIMRRFSPVPEPRPSTSASLLSTSEIQALTPHLLHFDASIKGDLKSFELFDVLEFLRLQTKTGSLVISSPSGAGTLRMVTGEVAWASVPGLKAMGDTLVDAGVISRGNLQFAIDKQQLSPAKLSENQPRAFDGLALVLLNERLVTREVLRKFVFKRIMEALTEMMAWKQGAFSFHPAELSELPPITFNLQEVMMELMRLLDEKNNPHQSTA